MAAEVNVYVPDRTSPFRLPSSLTDEEIRRTVVGLGFTACENADLVTRPNGDKVFQRITGGAKA